MAFQACWPGTLPASGLRDPVSPRRNEAAGFADFEAAGFADFEAAGFADFAGLPSAWPGP